ncbi:MAG: hypothetical protein OSB69_11205 [Alphaproteobacteria bacterium]|nr:hypothetical protein [Alphaproteobacteria bacterium]
MLEAVLPNYSGVSCGQLTVIPWRGLRDQATFSEHDLLIMQNVMCFHGKQPIDPIYIRLLCQRADPTDNPKEDTRQLAHDQTANNRFDRKSVHLSCLAQLTRKCCISCGDAFMAKANANANAKTRLVLVIDTQQSAGFDIRMLIERVVQFVAKRGGTSVENVRNWMDSPVGLIALFGSAAAR